MVCLSHPMPLMNYVHMSLMQKVRIALASPTICSKDKALESAKLGFMTDDFRPDNLGTTSKISEWAGQLQRPTETDGHHGSLCKNTDHHISHKSCYPTTTINKN